MSPLYSKIGKLYVGCSYNWRYRHISGKKWKTKSLCLRVVSRGVISIWDETKTTLKNEMRSLRGFLKDLWNQTFKKNAFDNACSLAVLDKNGQQYSTDIVEIFGAIDNLRMNHRCLLYSCTEKLVHFQVLSGGSFLYPQLTSSTWSQGQYGWDELLFSLNHHRRHTFADIDIYGVKLDVSPASAQCKYFVKLPKDVIPNTWVDWTAYKGSDRKSVV